MNMPSEKPGEKAELVRLQPIVFLAKHKACRDIGGLWLRQARWPRGIVRRKRSESHHPDLRNRHFLFQLRADSLQGPCGEIERVNAWSCRPHKAQLVYLTL
jgi:hypothetical protein